MRKQATIPSGGREYTTDRPSEGDMTQYVSRGTRTGDRGGDVGVPGGSEVPGSYTDLGPSRKILPQLLYNMRTQQDPDKGIGHGGRITEIDEDVRVPIKKGSTMSCYAILERVNRSAAQSSFDKVSNAVIAMSGSVYARVKLALDLAQNPALATAGQLAAQQPSPALPQVNELMTQLAMKQLQEELNKSTAINDPMEAENSSLRKQRENLQLKKELAEMQQEMAASAGGGMPPGGGGAPGGMPGGEQLPPEAQPPGFDQAMGVGPEAGPAMGGAPVGGAPMGGM